VHDSGSGFARPPSTHVADPFATGGRGCVIVEALSAAWGVDCDDDGCTVWCEVEVGDDLPDDLDTDVPAENVHRLAMEMAEPAVMGSATA
jgi:hypothetical protein